MSTADLLDGWGLSSEATRSASLPNGWPLWHVFILVLSFGALILFPLW